MRFSHTADCHIGGHRNQKLKMLTEDAFGVFVSQSIEDEVDFCLIAGDLFNTAIPGIDTLKFTVTQLGRLKEKNIPVYVIPGSHDFSPSGKSMIDVLEKAKLLVNVCKYEERDGKIHLNLTTDKTGTEIAGLLGKRGMLDIELYKNLVVKPKENSIFLFHTSIEGSGMPGMPKANLPEGFSYYAGGHVHTVKQIGNIVYPGPLFPNSFSELEELQHGGYWLYDNGELTRKDIKLKPVITITVDVNNLSSEEANEKLQKAVDKEAQDTIVLIRIEGTLASGSITDINLVTATETLQKNGAYVILRNTVKLTTTQFVENQVSQSEDLEKELIEQHKEQLMMNNKDGTELTKILLQTLSDEQLEGERQYEYEERILKEAHQTIQDRA